MYIIKQIPEDFKVEEVTIKKDENRGDYSYFLFEKKNYSTPNAIIIISQFLKIPARKIGYAGSKDKKAITKQLISIKDFEKNAFDKFDNKKVDFKFTYTGKGENPISLGDLEGNKFEIIVRNIDHKPELINHTINYYDNQRFAENNAEIGKSLIKGDYKKAAGLIKDDIVRKCLMKKPGDYITALKKLQLKVLLLYIHAYQSYMFNETVKLFLLCKYNKEIINNLQCKDKNLQCNENTLLCKKNDNILPCKNNNKEKITKKSSQCNENNLQCNESTLLCNDNFLLCKYKLGELLFPKFKVENIKIPIIGFSIEKQNELLNKIIKEIMEKENLKERDFINRQIPDLSCEGGLRDLLVKIKDLKISNLEKDELNPGKNKCKISFFLQKGSYATIVIKNLFSQEVQ